MVFIGRFSSYETWLKMIRQKAGFLPDFAVFSGFSPLGR
jgi:hypothetical protein